MTPERAAMKAWTATTKHRQTRKQDTMTAHDAANKLTGARLRTLRKRRGVTIQQMIDNSGVQLKQSSISRVELGERALTEIEATAIAAYFGVAVSEILKPYGDPMTEQQFLGNEDPQKPALFAVPDMTIDGTTVSNCTITIDLKKPLTPEQYRAQVWVPYLEARYAADHHEAKAG